MWFSFGVFPKKWQIDKQGVLIREGAERVKGAQSFFRISWGEWKGRLFGAKEYLWKMLSLFFPCLKAKICNLSKTARVSSHAERNKCHVLCFLSTIISNYLLLNSNYVSISFIFQILSRFWGLLRKLTEEANPQVKLKQLQKLLIWIFDLGNCTLNQLFMRSSYT